MSLQMTTELLSCGDYWPAVKILAAVFAAGMGAMWVFVRVRYGKGIRLQRDLDRPL